jgi:hypothetical protein
MKHLDDAGLIDALDDGQGPAGRHAAQCGACGEKLAGLREAIARAEAVDIPEPSPLFWDHFSARVHAAVDGQSVATSWWRSWLASPAAWAVAAAAMVVALVAGVWQSSAPPPAVREANAVARTTPAASSAAADTAAVDLADDLGAIDADEAWAVVRTVADGVEWDDDAVTARLFARPGWAERAAQTLTADEREQLLQLLQAETAAARKLPGA